MPTAPPVGLVGHWKLDDGAGSVAIDSSGAANHGALLNGVGWGAGTVGGASLHTRILDQHIRIPDSDSLNSIADAFTVSAWVNPAGDTGAYQGIVTRQLGNDHRDQWYLTINAGRPIFSVTTTAGTVAAPAPALVADGAWVHLAGTYDGTTIRLFVNGLVVATATISGRLADTATPLIIGGNQNGPLPGTAQEQFNGRIDDVQLFNRALPPVDVAGLMVGTPPPPPPPPPTTTTTTLRPIPTTTTIVSSAPAFSVTDGRIYDPAGAEFVPLGTNLNGFGITGIVDFDNILAHLDQVQAWNWTAMRVILCSPSAGCAKDFTQYGPTELARMDQLVEALAARKIVTIFSVWSGVGCVNASADLGAIEAFWSTMATRYAAQPYVWFNLYNEPSATDFWLEVGSVSALAIRNAGARNIIVIDSTSCANDLITMNCTTDVTKLPMVQYLDRIRSFAGDNLVVSNHYYTLPTQCTDAGNIAAQTALIAAMRARNIGFMVGEAAVAHDNDTCLFQGYTANIWDMFDGAARPAHVGVVVWHTEPTSDNCSLTTSYHWWDLDQLTESGQRFWAYTHDPW